MPHSHHSTSHHHSGSHHIVHHGVYYGSSRYNEYEYRPSYSSSPVFGLTRYYFMGEDGKEREFYADKKPERINVDFVVASRIIAISLIIAVATLLFIFVVPKKLPERFCEHKATTVLDRANVLTNESDIERAFEEFYEETGIQPYIYTIRIEDVPNSYLESDSFMFLSTTYYRISQKNLEEYAKSVYNWLFDDEGHWLFVFVVGQSNLSNSSWCDMAGLLTSSVVTNKLYTEFSKRIRNYDMFSSSNIVDGIDYCRRIALNNKTPYSASIIIFSLLFITILLISMYAKLQKSKNINGYLDYVEAHPGYKGFDDEPVNAGLDNKENELEEVLDVPVSDLTEDASNLDDNMITCPYCKEKYDRKDHFCPFCGGDNHEVD